MGFEACWCGSTEYAIRFRTPVFGLLRCSSCGCYRVDPPPLERDEESGDFYTTYYDHKTGTGTPLARSEGPAMRSRFWEVVNQVPALLSDTRSVIDFGSGDGRLCHELVQAGWRQVVGVDVSRARVARARAQYPWIHFYDRPLDETGLPSGAADLCVMDNVIEHLAKPDETVRNLRRYIRPNGKLVVITPNMESGHFRLLGRRWTPELAPHTHIFLFTGASLSRLLSDAGFVVSAEGVFHERPWSLRAWVTRLLSGDVKGACWRAHRANR